MSDAEKDKLGEEKLGEANSNGGSLRSHGTLGALTFEDITVRSPGGRSNAFPLPRLGLAPLRKLARDFFNLTFQADAEFAAIRGITAYIKPGQFCLLMGPPGCGKSTLLRALSGHLHAQADQLEGRICLGGIERDPSDPLLHRLANYVGSGDTAHCPVLTVQETFAFASACALPYDAERVASSVARMEKVLGLSHVKDTVVGGEELRGISGGQKRRVSFGEMAFGWDAPLALLDDITNGLDAVSSKNLTRAVHTACATYGFAAMATLLQPPQEVFEEFDTVLALTGDGRQAYFGPRSEALAFFEAAAGAGKPPEKSEPEFIQEVLSKLVSSEALATRYEASPQRQAALQAVAALNRLRTRESIVGQVKATPSEYANGFWRQFRLSAARRWLLVARNEMTLRRPVVAILFGFVTGTLFWDLPNDLVGTVSKSGFLFLSLFLVLMLSAAVTLPENFRQRPVFFKHRAAHFYTTPSYYLAMVLLDIPLAVLESVLLAALPYWMVGMRSGASHFIYFWSVLLGLEFAGQAWGRFVSAVCPTEVMANVVTTAYIFTCGLVSGYMPSYTGIGWWWRWLSWVTPVSYGFEGLMINEFNGRDLNILIVADAADGSVEIGSVDGGFLISTLFSLPRQPYDSAKVLDRPGAVKVFDVCMIFTFSLVLDLAAMALLDVSRRRFGAQTRRHQLHVGPEWHGSGVGADGEEPTVGLADGTEAGEETDDGKVASAVILTVEGLTYEVDVKQSEEAAAPTAASAPAAPADAAANTAEPAAADGEAWHAAPVHGDDAKNREDGAKVLRPADSVTFGDFGTEDGSDSDGGRDDKSRRRHGDTTATYGQNARFSFTRAASSILVGGRSKGGGVSKSGGVSKCGGGGGGGDREDPLAPGRLRLLTSVTAVFRGGEMTALMGESGAGKTTLLDVIAGYKTGGHITGGIFINGNPKDDATWRLVSGYCEQSDIHNPYLSVLESLEFAAHCRLPATATAADRTAAVDRVMELMELSAYGNMVVGREGAGEGLPKHARKRLTIAVELVSGPSILFMDEPTTGLDAMSADIVLSSVRRCADALRLAVVAVIHQPSRALFETFDALVLLKKGGRVVYSGPIHDRGPGGGGGGGSGGGRSGGGSTALVSYLEGLHPSFQMSPNENPADFALQIIEGKRTPGVFAEATDPRGQYLSSKLCAAAADEAAAICAAPTPVAVPGKRPGFSTQLRLLWRRQFLSLWRNSSYSAMRFLWTLFGAVMVGTVFLQLDNGLLGAVLSIGAIFFAVYVAVVPMQAAVVPLVEERAVLYRETASGTYSHWAYAFGQLGADIPFHLSTAVLFSVIFYLLVGLRPGAEYFGYFVLIMMLAYWCLPSIGQLFALLSPNVETANGLAGLTIILSTLLMGFLMPFALLPKMWKWAYWANILRYMLQGLCVNELANRYYPLDLASVIQSMDLSSMDQPVLIFPEAGADLDALKGVIGDALVGAVNSTVTGIKQDFIAAEGDNLLACLWANDCFSDDDALKACVEPGIFNAGPCFTQAVTLATDVPELLGCLELSVQGSLACLLPILLPTAVVDRVARVAAFISVVTGALADAKAWLIDVADDFSLPELPVPGNVILAAFSWANVDVDAGPTGQNVTIAGIETSVPAYKIDIVWDTGTRYYYCIFAVCMFLLGIEMMKVFAIRYVCWIKR